MIYFNLNNCITYLTYANGVKVEVSLLKYVQCKINKILKEL